MNIKWYFMVIIAILLPFIFGLIIVIIPFAFVYFMYSRTLDFITDLKPKKKVQKKQYEWQFGKKVLINGYKN